MSDIVTKAEFDQANARLKEGLKEADPFLAMAHTVVWRWVEQQLVQALTVGDREKLEDYWEIERLKKIIEEKDAEIKELRGKQ